LQDTPELTAATAHGKARNYWFSHRSDYNGSRWGCNRSDGPPSTGEGIAALLILAWAVLLFGYGLVLNLAPLEFGRVIGIYVATLFIVWQVISFIAFQSLPGLPVLVGGTLVVVGGAIVAFWEPLRLPFS
jgi:hypothetical protein